MINKKIFESRKIEIYFFCSVSLIVLFLALVLNPVRTGDGHYYYGMLYGLYKNGSPALTLDVVEFIKSTLGLDLIGRLSKQGLDDEIYGVHFWAYSLFCLPAYFITELIGLNGLKAFQLTNAFLISITIFYVLIISNFSFWFRWVVCTVFLFSTGLIYFQWTHPEIFTAVGIVFSSILALQGRYKGAIFFASLASMQNPSAIFLIVPLVFFELKIIFCKNGRFEEYFRFFYTCVLCLIPAAVPYIWNLIKFGTYNPIASMGEYISFKMISHIRLYSFLFDLNQGLIVGIPFLFWAVSIIMIFRLFYFFYKGENVFKREDILVVGFILMIIPTFAQLNWNPGQSIFLRYAAWAGLVLLVWVAYTMEKYKYNIMLFIAIPAIVIQITVFSYLRGASILFHPSYLGFMPWVSYIWNINPHFYNPVPEIFYERLKGRELAINPPAVLMGNNGEIIRILTDSNDVALISREMCGKDNYFYPIDDRITSKIKVNETESGMYYVTGRFICSGKEGFRRSIEIKTLNSNNNILLNGWSRIEHWGSWSNAGGAEVKIVQKIKEKISIRFVGKIFLNEFHKSQKINVYINNSYYDAWNFKYPYSKLNREIILDSKGLSSNEIIFRFEFPNAKSPKDLNISSDNRLLGMGLEKIILDKVDGEV